MLVYGCYIITYGKGSFTACQRAIFKSTPSKGKKQFVLGSNYQNQAAVAEVSFQERVSWRSHGHGVSLLCCGFICPMPSEISQRAVEETKQFEDQREPRLIEFAVYKVQVHFLNPGFPEILPSSCTFLQAKKENQSKTEDNKSFESQQKLWHPSMEKHSSLGILVRPLTLDIFFELMLLF